MIIENYFVKIMIYLFFKHTAVTTCVSFHPIDQFHSKSVNVLLTLPIFHSLLIVPNVPGLPIVIPLLILTCQLIANYAL